MLMAVIVAAWPGRDDDVEEVFARLGQLEMIHPSGQVPSPEFSGGKVLTGVRWEEETDSSRVLYADSVHWPDAKLRPTGAVLYCDGGLIGYFDFGPQAEAGPVLVEWPEGRVLELR